MNLICFPHYTCGGLLCDIFQNTFSSIGANGGLASILHHIGKIGDSDGIFDQFDPDFFYESISKLNVEPTAWVGTHCWPGKLNLSMFDRVLVITTTTSRSKLYRWLRAYHHLYSVSYSWRKKFGLERIDKERETAKNYLSSFLPVQSPNVTNIEFSEIVEQSAEFKSVVANFDYQPHMERWKKLNAFLYDTDLWNCAAVRRFYEAEVEVNLNKSYVYQ